MQVNKLPKLKLLKSYMPLSTPQNLKKMNWKDKFRKTKKSLRVFNRYVTYLRKIEMMMRWKLFRSRWTRPDKEK